MRSFLLEQSRVVSHADAEANYHVFYHMAAGATDAERARYRLLAGPEAYVYTARGARAVAAVDDAAEWRGVNGKLEALGFGADETRDLFSLFAAVLSLGNLAFHGGGGGGGGGGGDGGGAPGAGQHSSEDGGRGATGGRRSSSDGKQAVVDMALLETIATLLQVLMPLPIHVLVPLPRSCSRRPQCCGRWRPRRCRRRC